MRKETYKKVMNKIKLPLERKEEIYENILDKKSKKASYVKPIFVTTLLFIFILLGSLGFTYAEEIKNTFNTIRIFHSNKEKTRRTTLKSSALLEMNYEADIPESDPVLAEDRQKGIKNEEYTFQELEELLEIKILKSAYYQKEKLEQSIIKKIDNKIYQASFTLENFTNAKEINKGLLEEVEDKYTMDFSFITKYAPNELKENSKSEMAGGTYREDVYYIKSLNTSSCIFKLGFEDFRYGFWIVRFDYENIHYTFWLQMYNKNEEQKTETMSKILESLYL